MYFFNINVDFIGAGSMLLPWDCVQCSTVEAHFSSSNSLMICDSCIVLFSTQLFPIFFLQHFFIQRCVLIHFSISSIFTFCHFLSPFRGQRVAVALFSTPGTTLTFPMGQGMFYCIQINQCLRVVIRIKSSKIIGIITGIILQIIRTLR